MDVIAKTCYGWKFSENVLYFMENYFILLLIW